MRTPWRTAAGLAVAAVAGAALAGCGGLPAIPGQAPDSPSTEPVRTLAVPADAQEATVVRVVDGDTLVLRGVGTGPLRVGRETKVRVLEIDTPEGAGTPECFGPEATRFARQQLPAGSTVHVTRDRDLLDRYGRTLLYVWTGDGTFYDEAAVRLGYARAVQFAPNDRHITRIRLAEGAARAERRGLWGAC